MKTFPIVNSRDEQPLIFHFQGSSLNTHISLVKILQSRKIQLPKNISIVTTMTKAPLYSQPLLTEQLTASKIPYVNKAKNVDYQNWQMTQKPGFIIKGLKSVKTDYVLILDTIDVLLAGDCRDIIKRFLPFKKDILYNATANRWPNEIIDKVRDRDWRGKFCHLNAGACIGKTNALLDFYTEVANTDNTGNTRHSEQWLVRKVFDKHQDTVDFDWECKIFQTMSRANAEFRDNKYIIS